MASLGTGLHHAFPAISPNTTTACMGCTKFAVSGAATLQSLPAATRPRNLPRQYQQLHERPRRQMMRTMASQRWAGELSVPQSLQARHLELLTVATVLMIVYVKVAWFSTFTQSVHSFTHNLMLR